MQRGRFAEVAPYCRLRRSLYLSMILVGAGAVFFSWVRIGEGDLPGTDYYVFPFLHHGHGEVLRPFFPGSWAVNLFLPSYLLSVILNTIPRRVPREMATFGVPFFAMLISLGVVAEGACDTLVPILVSRAGIPFRPIVAVAETALACALIAAMSFGRGGR